MVSIMTALANELARMPCTPCEGNVNPLPHERVLSLLRQLPAWQEVPEGGRIRREWRVKDFLTALDFFRRVGDLAEREDHHPDLHLVGYRNVAIEIWTHAAKGLTENDFILAAKIDLLPVELKG